MDRVAQLAELATAYVACEEVVGPNERDLGRVVTRHRLFWDAADLGFDPTEIEAAIDTALGGR